MRGVVCAGLMVLGGCDGSIDWGRALVGLHFLDKYEELWGLDVESPPVKHNEAKGVYVSALFLGDDVYTLTLAEGADEATGVVYEGIVRPQGEKSVLVIAIDRNNVSTGEDLDTEWAAAQDWANGLYETWSTSAGMTEPILSFANTNVEVAENQFNGVDVTHVSATKDHIRTQIGYEPDDYDILMIIDLDPAVQDSAWSSYPPHYMVLNWWNTPRSGNVDVTQLEWNAFARSMYSHEAAHLFGWPFDHTWPADPDNPVPELDLCPEILGWTDLDGDGVIEILDDTPYGMTVLP